MGRLRDLLQEGHEVEVVTGPPDGDSKGADLRSRVAIDLAVRRRAKTFRPDRVVAFAPEVPSGLATTLGVFGPIEWEVSATGLGRLRRHLRSVRNEGRDAILVPTRIAAERRPQGTPQVFHPGPGEAFLRGPRAEVPGDGVLRVVQIGAVRADKGVHLTVEAMQSLTRERDHVELHLVGDATDRDYLTRLKRRGEGVNMHIHDRRVPPPELAALLAGAHILAAPATADGTWGFALAEAMAVGLPVVFSNIGDHKELVGSAGVEVQAGDVKQLGTAFRKLFRDRPHWTDRSAAAQRAAQDRYGDDAGIRARLDRLLQD